MPTKDKIIVQYHLEISFYKGRKVPKDVTLESELKNVLDYICGLNKKNRKYNDTVSSKIYFLEKYEKNELFNVIFKSAKYNHVRNVIDTETLQDKGKLKGKKDGDEEKTHFSILIEDSNNAICLLEQNSFGIGANKIEFYLNAKAGDYYNTLKKSKFFKFELSIIPNEDFLTALGQMETINVASFIVDKRDLNASDFLKVSELDDIRDEIEIKVKKTKEASIKTKTIKDYYNQKDRSKIKRILVGGKSNNSPVQLDTERMKTKNTVSVETEVDTNEVKSSSIFEEFKNILLGV